MTAEQVIAELGLSPHPEGGHYAETWRDRPADGGRGSGTAIYFLLRGGESSAWHRIDAAELWHFYAGSSLELRVDLGGDRVAIHRLGTDLGRGQRPQALVPPGAWQSARCPGGPDAWSLVGCTVSPAFEFAGFELAPPGFRPQQTGDAEERER